jgi:hypothetical protein
MNKKILPVLAIILVTIALLVINNLTESKSIKDYALIFIISGMFLGVWASKVLKESKEG